MAIKEWIFNKYDGQEKSLVKRLLNSRGIKTEEDIKEWLSLNLEAYLEDGNLYAFVRSLEYVV